MDQLEIEPTRLPPKNKPSYDGTKRGGAESAGTREEEDQRHSVQNLCTEQASMTRLLFKKNNFIIT